MQLLSESHLLAPFGLTRRRTAPYVTARQRIKGGFQLYDCRMRCVAVRCRASCDGRRCCAAFLKRSAEVSRVRSVRKASGASARILARMSRGCYAENCPVEFKLYWRMTVEPASHLHTAISGSWNFTYLRVRDNTRDNIILFQFFRDFVYSLMFMGLLFIFM